MIYSLATCIPCAFLCAVLLGTSVYSRDVDDVYDAYGENSYIIANNSMSFPVALDSQFETLIDSRSNMNIVIWSKNDTEFDAKLWMSSGKVLQYRTTIVKTKGKIDYIELLNRREGINIIVIDFSKIEKRDMVDEHTLIAIAVAMILIWHDRKSISVKIALTVYLAYQMYMWIYVYPGTDVEIDDRVFKKFVF